jgi:hypothetical protein
LTISQRAGELIAQMGRDGRRVLSGIDPREVERELPMRTGKRPFATP